MFIAIVSLSAALISAAIIAYDLKKNPQQMKIMNAVWILSALWGSCFALVLYFCIGKERRRGGMPGMSHMKAMGGTHDMQGMEHMETTGGMQGMMHMQMDKTSGSKMKMQIRPTLQSVTLSTLHCGAGCTLADIIGSAILAFIPITLAGSALYGGWVFSYVLALIIGVYFQYSAINEMDMGQPKMQIIKQALKADFFSLTAWQLGMYFCMYLLIYQFEFLSSSSPVNFNFWFAMQQAMFVGFLFALPMNYILIKMGVKRGMSM